MKLRASPSLLVARTALSGTLALCLPTLYVSLVPETQNDWQMSHAAAAALAVLYGRETAAIDGNESSKPHI